MIEIRFHGRGGQGALTAARILASAFWKEGKYSLVLPEFRSERRSAPITVSLRVGEKPITLRSKIYTPDYLVVLDPSLLALKQARVLEGFKKDAGFIVVSAFAESKYLKPLHGCQIGIADANLISRKYGLGNIALPATGTAMLGAFAKITGLISLESVILAIQESGELPKKEENIASAKETFEIVQVIEIKSEQISVERNSNSFPAIELPLSTVSLGDTRNNLTGAWRKIKPYYENKIPPCKNACPLENEIPHWLSLLKQGKEKEAWEKLAEKNPFPAVTGRVCQAFCEDKCNRKEFDRSLSIRELEKYLGDKALAENWRPPITDGNAKKLYVAVVGSGPCGLSCAYYLARQGYQLVIFERFPVLGGMLRVGIPDFRLPKDVLEKEIKNILSIGTNFVCVCGGVSIDSEMLESIKRGYAAVFLAVGLQRPRRLNIEGEGNPNVLYGLDFLRNASFKDKAQLGRKVIVIGGGNTAIDAARTARRLGSDVAIFYRRTKAEMPAIKEEVALAQIEGIEIRELVLPIKILDGFIEFQRVKTGLVPIEGSNFLERFDKIIIAAGEEKEEISGASDRGKVFIAKDTANVPAAINSGRLGAQAIDYYLKTGQRITAQESQLKTVGFKDINTAYFKRQKRSKNPLSEAKRCFSCGVCDLCGNCWKFCPHMSVLERDGQLLINYDYCKGCGICSQECPRAVISQELEA